jgi:hypothetical protein
MSRFELMTAKVVEPRRTWSLGRILSWCLLGCAMALWAVGMFAAL